MVVRRRQQITTVVERRQRVRRVRADVARMSRSRQQGRRQSRCGWVVDATVANSGVRRRRVIWHSTDDDRVNYSSVFYSYQSRTQHLVSQNRYKPSDYKVQNQYHDCVKLLSRLRPKLVLETLSLISSLHVLWYGPSTEPFPLRPKLSYARSVVVKW